VSARAPSRTDALLAAADDELILGWRDSEWTGIAPSLEEDVAFASLAQDEIGHAQALYQLLADLEGGDPDELAEDFMRLIVDVASGRAARNELNEEREIAIWKDGVTL